MSRLKEFTVRDRNGLDQMVRPANREGYNWVLRPKQWGGTYFFKTKKSAKEFIKDKLS